MTIKAAFASLLFTCHKQPLPIYLNHGKHLVADNVKLQCFISKEVQKWFRKHTSISSFTLHQHSYRSQNKSGEKRKGKTHNPVKMNHHPLIWNRSAEERKDAIN